MKKTISVFVLITLFILTSFANATVLETKNYKCNFPPENPALPVVPTISKVGYTYNLDVNVNDPDGDKVQYLIDWDSTGFHDYSGWTELFASGQVASFSHSWDAPGEYVVKVQAKDEHGATSTWSNGLTITVNYQNQRRNIMLTGFWQPTSQMIAQFSTNPTVNPDGWQGENWENLGYDIYSFVAKEYYNNQGTWEWKYQQIWTEFWDIAQQLHPIAIIGFDQGAKENTWSIENKAVNWKKWYLDDNGSQPVPNPPDDTVCPGFVRFSTLPVWKIEKAVNNQTFLNAEVNLFGTPGFYFCGYLAYLEEWYQAQHKNPDDEYQCKAAGWINVNKNISLEDCIEATNITIKSTVEKVKKETKVYDISSTKFNTLEDENLQRNDNFTGEKTFEHLRDFYYLKKIRTMKEQ